MFDLYGTLIYLQNRITNEEISEYLFNRGYEVSPQQLSAALAFVAFIDYPRHGYENWQSFFSKIFSRLRVKVDRKTLVTIAKLHENRPYELYPDAKEAVIKAKKNGLKTAVVTSGTHFILKDAVEPIEKYLDFIITGFEAGCDKSNPKMYRRVLEILGVSPMEAIVIGDDLSMDVLLPKRLGMNAILLDRERKNVNCEDADAVANSLSEAMEITLRWGK
ncbi:MAG: HAD-IA family hydrolase [Candidatus Bathyarchaeota archaeon]|nr:MAG: HAD-IA family hydrolase [Candidatus Bathyarchaeota archaeon]